MFWIFQTLRYPNGGFFKRAKVRAVKWQSGLSAFGLGLDIATGYVSSTRFSYTFGEGRKGKKTHYVCGNVKNQSPKFTPRVFTGAAPS